MSRLSLRRINTPARLLGIENWDEFGRYGEVKLNFKLEGKVFEFKVGYTKPYSNQSKGIFAKEINLNQNLVTSKELKKLFQDWQNLITHNGTFKIDIIDFKYEVLSK